MSDLQLGDLLSDQYDERGKLRDEPLIRLCLWTPAGRDRSIVLSEEDLARLASQASGLLYGIYRRRRESNQRSSPPGS